MKAQAIGRKPSFPPPLALPPEPAVPDAPLSNRAAWDSYAVACKERARVVAAMVRNHSHARVAAADAAAPIDYRRRHCAVEGSSVPTLERSDQQQVDSHGRGGDPWKVNDTLATLERMGSIDATQRQAGERLAKDFRRAGLDGLKALDPGRVPVHGNCDPHEVAVLRRDARDAVWFAMKALGGPFSPLSRVCWAVLGEDLTLAEYSRRSATFVRPETASGLLVGALDVLVVHYGLDARRAS